MGMALAAENIHDTSRERMGEIGVSSRRFAPLTREAPMHASVIEISSPSAPNTDLLRRQGWLIISTNGRYCCVWKDNQEIILFWKDGAWIRVGGRGILASCRS
jgi:hypothetical protein